MNRPVSQKARRASRRSAKAVPRAVVSSTTTWAPISRRSRPGPTNGATLTPKASSRTLSSSPLTTAAACEPPAATTLTAANCDPPEKMSSDMTVAFAVPRSESAASTPKERPKTETATATERALRRIVLSLSSPFTGPS